MTSHTPGSGAFTGSGVPLASEPENGRETASRPLHARIYSVRRLVNSGNGNPRWVLYLTNGVALTTKPDAACGGIVEQVCTMDADVLLTLDQQGLVSGIEAL